MSKEKRVNGISFIIPNWNGIDYIPRCLSNLFESLNDCQHEYEVIIVDNGSKDASVNYLRENFPQVKLIEFDNNTGFANACNEGAKQSRYNLLFFLNNDVFVQKSFLNYLISHFLNDVSGNLFAVSCRLLYDGTDELNLGRTLAKMPLGLFGVDFVPDHQKESCYTLYPSGGASLIDKEKFFILGGFDPHLYYFEDVDLGYRAWKRGWQVIYEPKSTVYHVNFGTSSKFMNRFEINTVAAKGRFVFTWKAITNPWLRLKHYIGIPIILIGSILRRRSYLFYGFIRAIKDFKYSRAARKIEMQQIKLDDLDVFKKLTTDSVSNA